jgi:hypothetical protein
LKVTHKHKHKHTHTHTPIINNRVKTSAPCKYTVTSKKALRAERKQKMLDTAAQAWVSYGFQISYISFRLGETGVELLRVRGYYVGVNDVQ